MFEPFCIQFAHCSTCVFVWFGLFRPKTQNSLVKFLLKTPGTSHANVGGPNGLDSVWPLPFRRGSWQWQLLWLRHPPYDATPIAPEFPSEGRCQWQGPVGGQQLGFGYTQLVTQRGWGIRGCRGRSYIRSSCNLKAERLHVTVCSERIVLSTVTLSVIPMDGDVLVAIHDHKLG